jgi:hypothetical protein
LLVAKAAVAGLLRRHVPNVDAILSRYLLQGGNLRVLRVTEKSRAGEKREKTDSNTCNVQVQGTRLSRCESERMTD